MSAVPELKDEINRKALETISHLITSVHNGSISPHQFSTGVDALWMAVSGLVNDDITDLMTVAGNEAPKGAPMEKRVFAKGRETIVVDHVVGDDVIYIRKYFDDGMSNTKRQPYASSAQARDNMIRIALKLLSAGFIEI